jgi:histidinol-phosphate/aromatic aminotransferase/cobyric acid decarboxylase-like protein
MDSRHAVSRRRFLGGVTAVGTAIIARPAWAQQAGAAPIAPAAPAAAAPRARMTVAEYDAMAKLASNENPYGPPESVLKAMTEAVKYANRYGYPDGDVTRIIAEHHGVKPESILLGAGSGEILDVVGTALLLGGKKVIGVEPSYSSVYRIATSVKAEAITLPLTKDYRQDMQAMITTTKRHYREVGFVYLCNPNNPTGVVVTKAEIKTLLDGIPEDVPVLIDEAYHHFVDDPSYATSIPYVIEGPPRDCGADVLEDRGAGRDAARLRRGAART